MISNSSAGSNAALPSQSASKTDDRTLKALTDTAAVKTGSDDQDMDLKQADALDSPTTASSPSSSDISDFSDGNQAKPSLSSSGAALAGMVTSTTITTQDHLNENNKRLISLTAQW